MANKAKLAMMFVFFTLACTVIEAPQDFDALTSYLFQHFENNDNDVLEAGAENMVDWLETNGDQLLEGYQVDDLSLEAVHSVDPSTTEVSLMGVAAGLNIHHSVNDVAYLLFIEGHNDDPPSPDATSYNIRTYHDDQYCFVTRECELLNYSAEIAAEMPLNILVHTTIAGQVRWVDSTIGPILVQRRWFTSVPEVSVEWLDLRTEYALMLSLPFSAQEGSRRIEMTWLDVTIGDIPISEDIGVMLGLNAIKDNMVSLQNQSMPE